MQGLHHNRGLLLGNDLVHGVDAVLLVVLHSDDDLVHAEHLSQILAAADDLLRALQHGAVVAGDVRLALRAVDDDGVHLADAAGDFDMGGERCAAHTDDTGVFDDLHHLIDREGVGVRGGLDLFRELVLEIVLDHHGRNIAAHTVGAGLHNLDRAGNTGVNRRTQTAEFADLLAHFYMIPGFDQGCARCAKVHRHGDDHLCRRCQLLDGLFIGRGFHVIGMNAAKESLCHCLHLIFTPDSVQGTYRLRPAGTRAGAQFCPGDTTTYCV